MKRVFVFLISVFVCLSAFSQIKNIEGKSEISSVIIYNSSAEIIHTGKVSIPAGKSTIVFSDLTQYIVENTTNISCSNTDVEIITVTEKTNFTKVQARENSKLEFYKDSIVLMQKQISQLRCKTEAFEAEKRLLFSGESIGGVENGVAVSEIEKASAFFSNRYLYLLTEINKCNEAEELMQTKILNFQNQIDEMSVNVLQYVSEIFVTVQSSQPQTVDFTFKYLTEKSGWAPVYDVKYFGENKPIKFVFRANIYNATGVDWNDINVKLSTANPTVGFNTPSLSGLSTNPSDTKTYNRDGVQFKEIAVMNSIEEYNVVHKYSVPTDGKPYLIDVKVMEMNMESYYLLIPKVDPFGFLMAKIPDWNKHNLIPGVTNIYNRGSYMGKTFLNTYAENDTLSLFLGKDNNIQSVRKEVVTGSKNYIIGNYYIDKTDIDLSIKNNLPENVKIKVLDQIPVIDYKDKSKFTLENPDMAIVDQSEGLLTWDLTLGKSETKDISFGYEFKTPKNEGYSGYRYASKKFRTISCPAF